MKKNVLGKHKILCRPRNCAVKSVQVRKSNNVNLRYKPKIRKMGKKWKLSRLKFYINWKLEKFS